MIDFQSTSQDRWLALAWKGWFIYALMLWGLLIAGMPLLLEKTTTPCDGEECPFYQITSVQADRLIQAGIPLTTHATLRLGLVLIFDTLLASVLTLVLFWRKQDDWIALILAIPMVSHAANYPGAIPLIGEAYPALLPLTLLPESAILVFWYMFFCTFPDGRFVPRWGRWLVFISLGCGVAAIIPAVRQPGNILGFLIGNVWFPLSFVFGLVFQVYRYRTVSTFAQRQQALWLIYGLAVSLLATFIVLPSLRSLIPALADADSPTRLYFDQMAESFFGPIVVLLGFWIAVLRHRMFDIDIIIRRTLQYAILTGLLALTYFGSIVLIQNLFFSDQTSEIAIVISTLGIAALFNPLRNRVQDFIDRRFYRKKYNAEQALAEFAAIARDEVDMDKLTAALIGVVQETVQPETVSLWLIGESADRSKRKQQPDPSVNQ